MNAGEVRCSTEWGNVVHLIGRGKIMTPGLTRCGQVTKLLAPPYYNGKLCAKCFPDGRLL